MTRLGSSLTSPWPSVALSYLVSTTYGHAFSSESFNTDRLGVPVIRIRDVLPGQVQTWANETPPESAWVADGDVVIGMDGDFNHTLWAGGPAAMNQRVCALRPNSQIDRRYLHYVLGYPLKRINETVHYTTVKHLSFSDLLAERIPVPPIDVQRRIADMLDAETARIDTLIEKNEQVLELLDRRFQRLLLELLGDWRAAPTGSLRQLGTVALTGPFGTALSADEYVDGGVPVVNPSHIRDGRILPDHHVSVSVATAERLSRYRLCTGDLILGRKGDVGRSALVEKGEAGWICGSDSMVLRTDPSKVDIRFLMWATRSDYYRQQLNAQARGSTMQGLNEGSLLSFRLPVLAIDQQRAIVRRADDAYGQHSEITRRVHRQQELLRLRRSALITAAVTGEIEP